MKVTIPNRGEIELDEVAVGDTVQFPGDKDYYSIMGINEDGIVVKKLDIEAIAEEVMRNNEGLFKRLAEDD